MNIYEDFIKYELHSVHIKDNPTGDGLSVMPITNYELTADDYDNLREGIYELLNDASFTDGAYDFLAGVLTLENETVVFNGSQTRDVMFTKLFRTPVPA